MITKTGFLKEDLYYFPGFYEIEQSIYQYVRTLDNGYCFLKTEERNNILDIIKNEITIELKKGTKFVYEVCEEDGEVLGWRDDINYGIECRDNKWAEEYLENIKPIQLTLF